jgi:amino acid adenylation domain-containing protein
MYCDVHGFSSRLFFLSVYAILLHKCSAQQDLSIGVSFPNRANEPNSGLFGAVSNTVPLAISIDESLVFSDFIRRLGLHVDELAELQDVPYESILSSLGLKLDTTYLPLFQVAFSYETAPSLNLSEVNVANELVLPNDVVYDLFFRLYEAPESLGCFAQFNLDLFSEATVSRFVSHFEYLIDSILNTPSVCLAQLTLLSPVDRTRILKNTANNQCERFLGQNLVDLFNQQTLRSPNATALVYDDIEMTYKDLGTKSELLAGHLVGLGVEHASSIGIYMNASMEMVIAIYGVLKAGCAYVPLDLEYPEARLGFILSDTNMSVVITNGGASVALGNGVRRVDLSTQWQEISNATSPVPQVKIKDSDAAYILYTSGSTGKPKGVINTHGSVCNHMLWIQEAFKFSPEDKMLQKTPYIFDGSLWEFFWPLQVGATLVIAPNSSYRDLQQLVAEIEKHRISIVYMIPSLLNIFLDALTPGQCGSLKIVISGGEMVSQDLQQKVFSKMNVELLNFYGPTEAAISVTCWRCVRSDNRHFVPIGYPIANTQIYLVDKQLQLVPDGIYGEILIGGAPLAKGYLNRAELTEQVFINDVFSALPNGRLYKTGDMGRRLADGSLQILGRVDDQVKIFGRRIELGEIEANIIDHPGVSQAVVTTHSISENDMRIVAYVVPDQNSAFSVLQYLKHREDLGNGWAPWEAPNKMTFSIRDADEASALFDAYFANSRCISEHIEIPDGSGIVVDVGAGIGMFSIFAASTWHAKVTAFETNPDLVTHLRTNLDLFKGDICFPTLVDECQPLSSVSGVGKSLLALAWEHVDEMGFSQIDLLHVNANAEELLALQSETALRWCNVRHIAISCRADDQQVENVQRTLRSIGYEHVGRLYSSDDTGGVIMFYGSRLESSGAKAAIKPGLSSDYSEQWYSPSHFEESIRQFLISKLSSNMIPSYIEVLPSLPLTPSGKISRLALPKPSFRLSDKKESAPRSDAESQCVALWERLLLRSVSVEDSFFDVGGNSFLAIQLVSEISRAMGKSIPVVKFFQYPTIRSFVKFLDGVAENNSGKNETLVTRASKQQQAFRRELIRLR